MLEESAVAAGVCGARSGRAGSRRKTYIVVINVGQWWGQLLFLLVVRVVV